MIFTLEASELRAVVKNTFVHIERVDGPSIDVGYQRKRRHSDVLDLRLASQPCKLFESEVVSDDSEVLSTVADDASEDLASDVTEVDTAANADIASLRVVTKRTFIHFELVAEDCSEIGLLRRRPSRRNTDILHARDAEAQSYKSAMEESMSDRTHDKVVSPDALVNYDDGLHSDAESNSDSSDMWTSWSNDCNPRAVTSVGSALHLQGLCRPCVWFWRPETCNKGVACEYCHLCGEDALARMAETKKAIKKQKKRINRHRRR